MKNLIRITIGSIFLSVILLLYSCGDSSSPSNNNNNNNDTTKKGDTIKVLAMTGYSFGDMANHASQDSCDFIVAITNYNHKMSIVLQVQDSKIQYFENEPDLTKITLNDVNSWGEFVPDPKLDMYCKIGYYYILKAKNGKFYQLYTTDILNKVYPMPKWVLVLLWKEVQIN